MKFFHKTALNYLPQWYIRGYEKYPFKKESLLELLECEIPKNHNNLFY